MLTLVSFLAVAFRALARYFGVFFKVCFCAKVLRKFIFAIVLLRLVCFVLAYLYDDGNAIGAFYVISSTFAVQIFAIMNLYRMPFFSYDIESTVALAKEQRNVNERKKKSYTQTQTYSCTASKRVNRKNNISIMNSSEYKQMHIDMKALHIYNRVWFYFGLCVYEYVCMLFIYNLPNYLTSFSKRFFVKFLVCALSLSPLLYRSFFLSVFPSFFISVFESKERERYTTCA